MNSITQLNLIKKSTLYVLIAVILYFIFLPSFFSLYGFYPDTIYFSYPRESNAIWLYTFTQSSVLSIGLYYLCKSALSSFFKGQNHNIPNENDIDRVFSIFIFILLLVIAVKGLSDFSLLRSEIKSNSSFFYNIFINLVLVCSSYVLLKSKNIIECISLFFLVIATSVILFEREMLLYALLPIFFRFGARLKLHTLIAIGFGMLIFFSAFKLVIRDYKFATNPRNIEETLQDSIKEIGSGSSAMYGLQIEYLKGNHPEYKKNSFLMPYQIFKGLDSTHTTNGRLATEFYTDNRMGTGFSLLLESWINFSILGPFIVPIIFYFVFRYSLMIGGSFLIVPLFVFLIKAVRGDFWVALLLYLIFPILFFIFFKFAKHLLFKK